MAQFDAISSTHLDVGIETLSGIQPDEIVTSEQIRSKVRDDDYHNNLSQSWTLPHKPDLLGIYESTRVRIWLGDITFKRSIRSSPIVHESWLGSLWMSLITGIYVRRGELEDRFPEASTILVKLNNIRIFRNENPDGDETIVESLTTADLLLFALDRWFVDIWEFQHIELDRWTQLPFYSILKNCFPALAK